MTLAMGAGTIEDPVAGSVGGPRDTKGSVSIEGTIIVEFIETGFISETGDGINRIQAAVKKPN